MQSSADLSCRCSANNWWLRSSNSNNDNNALNVNSNGNVNNNNANNNNGVAPDSVDTEIGVSFRLKELMTIWGAAGLAPSAPDPKR